MKHILFALLVIFILILCGCAQERPSFDLSPSSDLENASVVTAIEELAFGYYPAVKKLIASKTVSFPEALSVTGTEDMEIVMQ